MRYHPRVVRSPAVTRSSAPVQSISQRGRQGLTAAATQQPPHATSIRLSAAPPAADAPDKLWLADMTEFALPGGAKVYLHPIVDVFDGAPVSWRIGRHPSKELSDASLEEAIEKMRAGAHPSIHSDRGVHYRIPSWIKICEDAGLVRSMSRKGCCADNSACEGFFGNLKTEFYYGRDWRGVSASEFVERLDSYLRYYYEERIKKRLGWLSPKEYRQSLGYAS